MAPGADEKKKDAEWGFDSPAAVVAVYADAIEKEKKDEAKDEKDKKNEKEKKDTAKKDEKKDPLPTLKKDAKPVVKLEFGKTEKDLINVKRTLQDGTVSRFTVKKELYEKIVPSEGPASGVFGHRSAAIPNRGGDIAEDPAPHRRRGTETIELERQAGENQASSGTSRIRSNQAA